jgi:hypothetical protein
MFKFLDLVQWLRLALSKGANRVGAAIVLPEDGNRSSFQNFVFFEKTLDDEQSPKTWFFQVQNTPSSEPFRIEICSN